jgi:hypothetical protein
MTVLLVEHGADFVIGLTDRFISDGLQRKAPKDSGLNQRNAAVLEATSGRLTTISQTSRMAFVCV